MVWFICEGEAPLYRLIWVLGVTDMALVEVPFGAAKGQGGHGICFLQLRRCSGAWWRTQWWSASSWRRARLCAVSADSGGRRRRLGPVGCGGVQLGMSRG